MLRNHTQYAPAFGLAEVPPDLRRVAETMASLYAIEGAEDAMLIAKTAALELGRGDGVSHFLPATPVNPPTQEAVQRLASRLFRTFATRKGMVDQHAGPASIATHIREALMLAPLRADAARVA